ncbi:hypothetical protein STCU_11598 [Strigomonas culicis]|uniref:Uncharacterized protein n=1 Tax=Strigomonas culicis TaxID=28005 RepID=S9TGJ3_9TRYP|nr:hypothetical protein STCU_11598 [Strigomonas culicis]|eukprot:EPY16034.1 hypothetical protein STCU_11598 [Strigomonas culicis]
MSTSEKRGSRCDAATPPKSGSSSAGLDRRAEGRAGADAVPRREKRSSVKQAAPPAARERPDMLPAISTPSCGRSGSLPTLTLTSPTHSNAGGSPDSYAAEESPVLLLATTKTKTSRSPVQKNVERRMSGGTRSKRPSQGKQEAPAQAVRRESKGTKEAPSSLCCAGR